MIGMQYRIHLPNDYDIQIIRKRVKENGHGTDGFTGLLFKCYLIQENRVDGFENIYAPLYIWNDSNGMNEFLFGGFYDNIIKSFGWQKVNIGVPLIIDLKEDFRKAKFVLEVGNEITPKESLSSFRTDILIPQVEDKDYRGRVCIYNPDKWKYSQFLFYSERPEGEYMGHIFQILYISEG